MRDTTTLRALAEAATPGPWGVQEWRHWADPSKPNFTIQYKATDRYNRGATFALASVELYGSGPGSSEANAAYIAAASPSVVLALLDRIDALEANAVRMREYRFAREGIATDGKGNPLKETT